MNGFKREHVHHTQISNNTCIWRLTQQLIPSGSLRTVYRRSGCRFPIERLSKIHSGFTTCTTEPFRVWILCVLNPLRPRDEMIWVDCEATLLSKKFTHNPSAESPNDIHDPSSRLHNEPFYLSISCWCEIPVDEYFDSFEDIATLARGTLCVFLLNVQFVFAVSHMWSLTIRLLCNLMPSGKRHVKLRPLNDVGMSNRVCWISQRPQ